MSYRDGVTEDRSKVIVAVHGQIAAVDVATGKEQWRNELRGLGHGVVEMLIADARIYLVVESAVDVVCLEYATGKELWRTATASNGRASLLRDGARLFVARRGYLDCFDLEGNNLWSNGLSGLGSGPTTVGVPGSVSRADAEGAR
jgi:PQQ-like domain